MQCGTEMQSAREDWPDRDLPGVLLLGVEVSRCPSCGEYEVELPRVEELHRVLAAAVLAKPARLAPKESRFLREHLGWTPAELAEQLGVTQETVSKWESAAEPMSPLADRLLRLLAARELGLKAPRDLVVIAGVEGPLDLHVRFGVDGWQIVDRAGAVETWAKAPPEERAAVLEALSPDRFDGPRRNLAEAAIAVLKRAAA